MSQEPWTELFMKGDFRELKSKNFPGEECTRKDCTIGARLVNRSVFILDRQLQYYYYSTFDTEIKIWKLRYFYFNLGNFNIITDITKKEYIKLVNRALIPLATICSCINPILYYRGNKRVKEEILKLIKRQ